MTAPDPFPPPGDDAGDNGGLPPASFIRVLGAVFASFLGIRKKAAGERDAKSIKPWHVIVAGVLGAALLATSVFMLVRFITRAG